MSVKVHEAFSLDSAQDRYLFFDHFLGDQLKDEWTTQIVGAGAIGVVDAQTGGIVRLTTGAISGNTSRIYWNNIRSLLVSKKVTMEVRAKLAQTTSTALRLMLFFDWSNLINFYKPNPEANWFVETVDGGATTQADSGETADTDYHVFRIECHTHTANHVHFYIDGVETLNSPITTNIPDDATDYLQPYVYLQANEDVAKTTDIDYVVVRQER